MGLKIPLFFEYDLSTVTPSSIGEFTASDTVGVKNGGTGASSMVDFFADAAAFDLSAKSVSSMTGVFVDLSATNFSAVNVISTEFSALNVSTINVIGFSCSSTNLSSVNAISKELSSTNVSAINIISTSLSATNLSAVGVSSTSVSSTYVYVDSGVSAASVSATAITGADAMPFPAPFGYVQCDSDGTDSTTEINFGIGATITNIVSNSDDITWNDTTKVFNVLKTGTYEVLANCVLDVGTQSDLIDMDILKNGSRVMAIAPRCFGNHGPFTRTILGVITATAADTLAVSLDPQAAGKSVTLKTGSTMTVKRLK